MRRRMTVLLLVVVPLLGIPLVAQQHEKRGKLARDFQAELRGRNEVPLTLTAARGSLELSVNETDTSVHFVLEYSGLQTPILFSHIHVGQPDVNGGVTVFFCGGGGRPACPQGSGTVEGDIVAANVLPLVTQQLEAANLDKLLAAIRAGRTYANLHTQTSPGGEIRGQITRRDDDDNGKDTDRK
jgi:hypothetical protein